MNGSEVDSYTDRYKFGMLGAHLTICLIKIVLNSLVLYIIARSSELHRPTGLVLANTSLSYLVIGVASLMSSLPGWFPEIGCGTYYQVSVHVFIIGRFNCSFSIILLNIDRLVAIIKPFSYLKRITPKRIYLASAVLFLVSILMTITVFYLLLTETKVDSFGCRNMFIPNSRYFFFLPGAIATCTVIVSYGYIIDLRTILLKRQKVSSTTVSGDKLLPVRRRFVPFVMIIAYFAVNFPIAVALAISDRVAFGGGINRILELSFKIGDNFALIINIIIFTSTYRTFRKATLRIFFRSLYRKRLAAEIIPSLQKPQVAKKKDLNVQVLQSPP